jgi:hypothetical protein
MQARLASYLVLAIGLAGEGEVLADKVACVQAADAAQDQRSAGKLKEARASLHTCASEDCPALVRSDCTRWLLEVETSMPTIVIRAENARGEDLVDVQVDLDGRRVADKLEGLPTEIDPGPHTLLGRADGKVVRLEIVVHTAEKDRAVTLRVESGNALPGAPRSALASEHRVGPGAAAWILAGVAVAGTASFAYFGLRGSAEVSDMRDECAGHCSASQVDSAHQKLLIADISLGTALVSAGVATYLFWSASAPPSGSPARQMGVSPLAGGMAAVWFQRF